MLEETGEKIFCLSQDTGKQPGNISTPALLSLSKELFASYNHVISTQMYYGKY